MSDHMPLTFYYRGFVGETTEGRAADGDVFEVKGFVRGMDPPIHFAGYTCRLARADFEQAIEDHLGRCRDAGVDPVRPPGGEDSLDVGATGSVILPMFLHRGVKGVVTGIAIEVEDPAGITEHSDHVFVNKTYWGRLIGTDRVVDFGGCGKTQAEASFRGAVDKHLDDPDRSSNPAN